MKIEEIRELHEMGFSADQILQISGTAPAAEPEADPEPALEPEAPTEPETPADDKYRELENQISEQTKQIQQLTKQLQAANRQAARVETLPVDDLQTQTDKIMAELIRPTIKEGE